MGVERKRGKLAVQVSMVLDMICEHMDGGVLVIACIGMRLG